LPKVPALDPMIEGLESHAKVRLGDTWVITGIPGSRKTTFVNDLTCHLAETYGWKIAYASPEQTPQSDHRAALRTWVMRKPEALPSSRELHQADEWIDRHCVFIIQSDQDQSEHDVMWFLEMAE